MALAISFNFFIEVRGASSNSAYYGYPELWILRYPAHIYHAVPSPGFEPTALWLKVRHPNHTATTLMSVYPNIFGRILSYKKYLYPTTTTNSNVIHVIFLFTSFLFISGSSTPPLEFGTVLIFTCLDSCWNERDNVKEESVIVQPDPDQHLFKL
jgi:hypothetical protein